MQHIKRLGIAHRIDGSIRITLAVFYNFQYPGAAKTFHRLGLIMLAAGLCQMQRVTKSGLNFCRHRGKVFFSPNLPSAEVS